MTDGGARNAKLLQHAFYEGARVWPGTEPANTHAHTLMPLKLAQWLMTHPSFYSVALLEDIRHEYAVLTAVARYRYEVSVYGTTAQTPPGNF